MRLVNRATHRDARVADQFYRVIIFLEPPAFLFRPRILAEVLRGGAVGAGTPAVRPDTRFEPGPPVHAAS
jgi:hypothetical protein